MQPRDPAPTAEPNGYIGIDFGTSNSHFAYCASSALRPEPIGLGRGASEQTCVLWRKTPASPDEQPITYGTVALEEYSALGDAERRQYRFAAGFKPELACSDRARRDARAFLGMARAEMDARRLVQAVGAGAGVPVVVGVPAEAGADHVHRTAEVAEQAGFGRVDCVAEPLGALAYHLANGDLTPAEAREGVAVVDFGGGTLDVAIVDHRGVRAPWGDPALGGRLFDDLFYQWLLDQNPGLRVADEDWVYVWAVRCRELKESFSLYWARLGRRDDFQKVVLVGNRAARLKGASVEEFESRARHYRPSPECLAHFRLVGGNLGRLGQGGTVDLLDWVRGALAGGPGGAAFRRVVLTGGSASWPFMVPLAADVFATPAQGMLCAREPERTVGAGLAVYHVMKHRLERTRRVLRADKPARKGKFERQLAARAGRFVAEVPRQVLDPLLEQVRPVFLDWHRNGGSLRGVEQRIEEICRQFESRLDQLLRGQADRLGADILSLLREHLGQWLASHGIRREVGAMLPADLGGTGAPQPVTGVPGELAGPLAVTVAASLAALVMAFIAVIKLTILTALSPLLLTPVGVVVAVVAIVVGKGAAQDLVKEHQWGSWPWGADLRAMWLVLSEARLLEKLRESGDRAREELRAKLQEKMSEFQRQAAARLEEVMEQVIADLGVLD